MATKAAQAPTTVADMIAAVKLGTLDPSTEVLTAKTASKRESRAISIAIKAVEDANANAPVATQAPAGRVLPTTTHECGIPGCRHGISHDGPSQPDRQVKLACTTCGAVARMTHQALARAGGMPVCHDGTEFTVAERRTYNRKAA